MNSRFIQIAIAFLLGLGAYHLFQSHKIYGKLEDMSYQLMSMDSGNGDTIAVPCPCDDTRRYNVDPREESLNIPIPTFPECSTMVANAQPKGVTITGEGAWFSKKTIDIMWCHKMDANGIYVYKAITAEGTPTYIIEAARSNKINTTIDASSYIYYSRTMCPNDCGHCGM